MKKKILALGVIVLAVAACGSVNQSITKDQNTSNNQLQQYQSAQPVPYFDYSQQRGELIDIYKAMNEQHNTWAVVTSYSGQLLFQCESSGFPIPADAQLTNPSQIAVSQNGTSLYSGVVGQEEPNGLYTGNTQGTYVLCIRANGQTVPIYTENNVQMFPFPVTVDDKGVIQDAGGASTITVTPKAGKASIPTTTPAP